MKMSIKEFASLFGVSVRTLHYYDKIGLLKPDFISPDNNYRFYGQNATEKMTQIMFYRGLDFSLDDIKTILSSPDFDKKAALDGQKKLLILKKEKLEKIIFAIESLEKGENVMEKFTFSREFDTVKEQYQNEAKARWGQTLAYREFESKTKDYSEKDWKNASDGINSIIKKFAFLKECGKAPSDAEALSLAKKLQDFITETRYTCTDEILLSLSEMYVGDARFTKNIDKNGFGTAKFMSDAIKEYIKTK